MFKTTVMLEIDIVALVRKMFSVNKYITDGVVAVISKYWCVVIVIVYILVCRKLLYVMLGVISPLNSHIFR